MTGATPALTRNIALYPWFKFWQGLMFYQAIWFLYFQDRLSGAEAILLYAVYDVATTVLEVPSGYMSDRLGRRLTLLASAVAGVVATLLLGFGDSFAAFALAQVLVGAASAFASGTDSSLLYESLAGAGRAEEVEAQELRAWRVSFLAFALSAVSGGAMALWSPALPFLATAAGFAVMLIVVLRFVEPPRMEASDSGWVGWDSLRAALTEPVLVWLFALAVLMYGFSHLPFVFGQPFILEALRGVGWDAEAPLVSGAVSALMMVLSVLVSLLAVRLRNWLGLPGVLLLAYAMQIALIGVLALTNSVLAIGFLFLRMVPNALSSPFIAARVQPLLADDSRATYLSVRSLVSRLLFAASLYVAAGAAGAGEMDHAHISAVLGWYVLAGLVSFAALLVTARVLRS